MEEFLALDSPEDREWELHDGEIVEQAIPNNNHPSVRLRLTELLKPIFAAKAEVLVQMGFQIPPDNVRSADVGVVSLVDPGALLPQQCLHSVNAQRCCMA